jgi:hypothetical protein
MTTTANGSATRPVEGPVAAVLDLLTSRERHADELALACATLLTREGGREVTATTHPAALADERHVAVVVEVGGLDATVVAAALGVLTDAGPAEGHGLLVEGSYSGAGHLRPALEAVRERHRDRSSGRAVVFPGSTSLVGTVTVADVLAGTRIARVQVLGASEPDPRTFLVTRGFVRPRWTSGQLVLHVQPAVGDVLVPFETPDPTPCCAAHH